MYRLAVRTLINYLFLRTRPGKSVEIASILLMEQCRNVINPFLIY